MLFCNRKIIFDHFCYRYCSACMFQNTSFVFINTKSCSKIWLCLRNREEHSANWYASQLCVTPQYLNRAIKSITQKTVYEHISIALTGSIIEQLEISEKPISQIAEAFHFPDLATMTKFFKRQTGKTPTEYRKSARA